MTDYLQAYTVTFKTGQIVMARVMAQNSKQGVGKAKRFADCLAGDGTVWGVLNYPVGDTERALGEGGEVIYTP